MKRVDGKEAKFLILDDLHDTKVANDRLNNIDANGQISLFAR
jgi:hypothetical protein